MSKYQMLNDAHNESHVDDDDNDDGDEEETSSLYNKNGHCALNFVDDVGDMSVAVVNGGTTLTYNNNNCRINAHDFDESTMEVPLLSNNNNDYEPASLAAVHCKCGQPGFGANLKNKSTQDAKFKILLAISLCCIFMIIEFLGGYIAGSLAIMTDAAHLASDCISFIIGLVAIWLGHRPPDVRMSFGYKRMEVMGAIVSILGIWILTATLVMVALQRIYSNDYDLNVDTMMTISGIGILINIAMAFILHGSWLLPGGAHGHSHDHAHSHVHTNSHGLGHGHGLEQAMMINGNANGIGSGNSCKQMQNGSVQQEKNLNLRAAMIHVIGDLVQSIGVFLASIFIKFYPSAKIADPLCTLLFSVIVIMTTVLLFRESVAILMDAVPHGIALDKLEMELSHIDGVRSVHHLNVWNHTANFSVLMVHLVIDLLTDSNTVLDKATKLATGSNYNIKHCTIQIERLSS